LRSWRSSSPGDPFCGRHDRSVEIFRQEMASRGGEAPRKTVLLGTIQGDVHDIGKNIIKIMLETNGFKVYDLGRDVPVSQFIDKVRELSPDIVGVSALMTTTMVHMPKLIEALKEAGLRDKAKVMVGALPYCRNGQKRSGRMVTGSRPWRPLKCKKARWL